MQHIQQSFAQDADIEAKCIRYAELVLLHFDTPQKRNTTNTVKSVTELQPRILRDHKS